MNHVMYAEKHLNLVKLSKDTLKVHINMRCKTCNRVFYDKDCYTHHIEELNCTSGERKKNHEAHLKNHKHVNNLQGKPDLAGGRLAG